MDIDTRIFLRSCIKPDYGPILKSIVGALLAHSLLWLNWPIKDYTVVTEVPDWINIKLVADFEYIKEKQSEPDKNIILKKTLVSKKEKIPQREKKQKIKKSTPTTYIKENSRPMLKQNPKPVYPAAARRRGMQGVVLLKVNVNNKGNVEKLDVLQSSGYKVLDLSAVNSVKHWKFIPAKIGEDSVSSVIEIPIKFSLKTL